jgi:hypothetical protein
MLSFYWFNFFQQVYFGSNFCTSDVLPLVRSLVQLFESCAGSRGLWQSALIAQSDTRVTMFLIESGIE